MIYEIAGASGKLGNIAETMTLLKNLGEELNIFIQLFDANYIYGREHLQSAIMHAERSIKNNSNLADNPSMEILLYASGERQIKLAINKIGIKDNTETFALVIYSPEGSSLSENITGLCEKILTEIGLKRDDSVLEGNRGVLERFGIAENELKNVPETRWLNLILAKVAMVDIIK